MAASHSSPIKPLRHKPAAHIRSDVEQFVVPDCEVELTQAQFWKEIDYDPKDFNQYNLQGQWCPKDDFQQYMNQISESICTNSPRDSLIEFHNTSNIAPLDHPTGTMCKPDFAACPMTEERIHWTEIDATVEIQSGGKSKVDAPRQAGSYTLYLLQSRPDRVAVQGFYADKGGIILLISSADSIKKSPKLDLKNTEQTRLIFAFIKRLYDPHPFMVDPTVKRRKDPTRTHKSLTGVWVFDITLTLSTSSSLECRGYRIANTHSSVGQRTHIFTNNDDPSTLSGVAIPVIKDQYRFQKHRFNEPEIIRYIHTEDDIPGIVHIVHSEAVVRRDGTAVCSGDRHKTRIGLAEYGQPFMDLKTPLEVLMVIYDLLETTRLLYFKRKVLHRDISTGNVMHTEKVRPVATLPPSDSTLTDNTSDQQKVCFVRHLLDPTVESSATVNLLIDFDRSEILDAKHEGSRLERTGTTMFMARAIRAGRPLGEDDDLADFRTIPDLSQQALAAYGKNFPERLIRFKPSPRHIVTIKSHIDPSPLSHELRHDAESAFWLLLYWVFNAAAVDGPITVMPQGLMGSLAEVEVDIRPLEIRPHTLDPLYAPLSELVRQLGKALQSDLYWATEAPYTHPDFLHEVFQRRILNFIFDNRDAEFMKSLKADASRKPNATPTFLSLSTSQIDSSRGRSSSSKRSIDPEPEPVSSKRSKTSLL